MVNNLAPCNGCRDGKKRTIDGARLILPTAFENAAKHSPNRDFAEFLYGYTTVLKVGGNVKSYVNNKLKKLRILPSQVCTDETFLRRHTARPAPERYVKSESIVAESISNRMDYAGILRTKRDCVARRSGDVIGSNIE